MYVILFAMRVDSTKFVRKLLHVREFWIQFSRLSHFIYLDFSTSHSCFPGCIPSVERLSGSVKYCLDFEHLQNDTSKGCAWYCGARLS